LFVCKNYISLTCLNGFFAIFNFDNIYIKSNIYIWSLFQHANISKKTKQLLGFQKPRKKIRQIQERLVFLETTGHRVRETAVNQRKIREKTKVAENQVFWLDFCAKKRTVHYLSGLLCLDKIENAGQSEFTSHHPSQGKPCLTCRHWLRGRSQLEGWGRRTSLRRCRLIRRFPRYFVRRRCLAPTRRLFSVHH
jgi:hypothetical protein